MIKHITTRVALFLALTCLVASPTFASRRSARSERAAHKPPVTFTGTISWDDDGGKLKPDGDTFWIKSGAHDEKVRLHLADCPERAHNSKETDQPGGLEALAYAKAHWESKVVTATVRGDSYGRKVCDIADADGKSLAMDLVSSGNAWVDPRYPSKDLQAAEVKAQAAHKGLWKAEKPIAPWDWRKKVRGE